MTKFCHIELAIIVICHIQITFSNIFIKVQERKISVPTFLRSSFLCSCKKFVLPHSLHARTAGLPERKSRSTCPPLLLFMFATLFTKIIEEAEYFTLPPAVWFSCVNLWGSYRCQCSPGYQLAADSRTCLGRARS